MQEDGQLRLDLAIIHDIGIRACARKTIANWTGQSGRIGNGFLGSDPHSLQPSSSEPELSTSASRSNTI